ncbi:hypothetical protein B0H19DRAFT_1257536 [Mycena capillaripes]|nr:hypothetical protein B0H19DRAFT_1257536 [Mycena capillaripes]
MHTSSISIFVTLALALSATAGPLRRENNVRAVNQVPEDEPSTAPNGVVVALKGRAVNQVPEDEPSTAPNGVVVPLKSRQFRKGGKGGRKGGKKGGAAGAVSFDFAHLGTLPLVVPLQALVLVLPLALQAQAQEPLQVQEQEPQQAQEQEQEPQQAQEQELQQAQQEQEQRLPLPRLPPGSSSW